jgi:hypothetical protein
LGTLVDEGIWEAARGSVRFEKIGPRMIRIGTALVFAVLASAALRQTTPVSRSQAEAPKAPPILRGLDLSAIDQSADPCTTSTSMHAATGRAQRCDVGGLSGRGGTDEERGALQLPSAGAVISNRHFTSHPLVINGNLLMAIRAVSYAAAANAKAIERSADRLCEA